MGSVSLAQASPMRPIAAEPATVTTGIAPRTHRDIGWRRDGMSGFGGWTALYDHDTEVPVRLWGPGQPAPGAIASPAVAEAWARAVLAAHLDTLAPGASVADFVVVANQLDPRGDVRSVGFAQSVDGIAVLGGTISFAFKRDRMIMAGSTALPNVRAALASRSSPRRLAAAQVTASATAWLASAGRPVVARTGVASGQVIVPMIRPRGASGVDISYTVAEQVEMEAAAGDAPGRWNVFVDAATGGAFARESTLMFESGQVLFNVPDRGPAALAGRHAQPAPSAIHLVNGAPIISDLDGTVSWTGAGSATVAPGLTGPLIAVTNKAGALVSDSFTLAAGGSAVWNRSGDEAADAQIDAFVYASQAKRFAKLRINPQLAYFDRQLSVNVNESSGSCNAYSTGDDLHFYPRTAEMCENAARIADIVYHEFGHSVHRQSIIPGVGQFDGAMSEGVGDTLAIALTGDPAMGRGFFLSNEPLRDLDPEVKKHWPQDLINEVHSDGEIYGETMWDLRTKLEAHLGQAAGFERFLAIYYGTVQRAVDIPSSFAEALVADDDDGDLTNGTPNECDIIAAFFAHGLFDPIASGEILQPGRNNFTISLHVVEPASVRCEAPTVSAVEVAWRVRGGATTRLALTPSAGTYSGTIPTQAAGSTVEYSVTATLSDGTAQAFPNNRADPLYQFYVGPVTKIWCEDFESGATDWSHGAMPASGDLWQVGAPHGLAGDPRAAYAGTSVLGIALDGDGAYTPRTTTQALSPLVDLHGYTNVHLQYYRWLGVEDGQFDHASIRANGTEIWKNLTNAVPSLNVAAVNSFDHVDREWRFVDLDVSAQATTGQLQLGFGLTSDPAYQIGGWNLDDVCLVAAGPGCGNGTVDPGEACDDGNTADGDGCSSTCSDEPAGCCSTGCDPAGPAALAGLALVAVGWRRRRRARG
jgi:cysteine-rich repeat protein